MSADELLIRGVSQVTPMDLAKKKIASGKKMRIYMGIDPTGAKLHLGHSVPLRKLKAFVDEGHEVIFLIGSFTAMIGDPTGRDKMREPLNATQVQENFRSYKEQAAKILDFKKVKIAFNHEWLEPLNFKDIIGLASHFTVQQMMERDMFEKRLKDGNPISMHEFLYPLMQGYDSVILDVDCEVGGNDQYFNMLSGRTLQSSFGKREKFVLTTKLIEGTDGRKMSKTYDNCIYITDEANDMFGKVMSIKDNLILTYFECCTDMSLKEVKEIEKKMKKGENPKQFKEQLGVEIVTLYHGKDAAEKARAEFQNVFANKGTPTDIEEVKVKKGSLLLDVLLEHNLIPSKAEGRRLIEQGGIKMNDAPIASLDAKVEAGIVKVGKRKFLRISL